VKLYAATGAMLIAAALAAAPALAVDEGVPDRAGHPYVGVVGADPDGDGPQTPYLWCSGSVISDRVFLTAAHCIVAQPPETVWYVTLAAGSPRTPIYPPALLGEDLPPFLVPVTRANDVVVHPDFGGFDNRRHDLAVVLFPPNTFAGVEPVELPKAHQLDRLDLGRKPIRLVGYGLDPEHGDSEADPVFVGEGYRQTATAPFLRLTGRQLLLNGDAAATRQGGLCLADSGSPQLLPGTNLALSLHSENAPEVDACRGVLREQRLDTRSERRFLARYLP
jgi:trypsin